MSTINWRGVVALLAAMSLTAAACGDDATDAVDAATDTAAETAEAATETAEAAIETAEADPAVEGETQRPADWPTSLIFGAVPAE